jgi:hypothetical protein
MATFITPFKTQQIVRGDFMNGFRALLISVCLLGSALPLEAATATWNSNPEPGVTGYVLSYGTQSGVHPTSITVGNVVSFQFFPPAGQRYYVVVQAYNSTGTLSAKSAEVILDVPAVQNQAPTLTQPANQTTAQNTAASLTLTATDPEGSALTYTVAGLPAGLLINASTGVISGTVTTAGTYNVTASASDGSLLSTRSFSWTVTAASASTTVVLRPIDTSINITTLNYSTDARLKASTYPANRVSSAILMKFDLSQIPANAMVQSATLQLSLVKGDDVTADPNYNMSLHQILNHNPDLTRATGTTTNGTTNWTANTCCYNNFPLAQADISPARAVTAINLTHGTKSWDAFSVVQAWRTAPATNYGLLLNGDATKGADRFRHFASVEDASVAQRPSLTITYSMPAIQTDVTPPTVSISAPASGATVSGATVSVSAAAADAVGVVGVQFRLDGANVGAEDTTAPYAITWNTTAAPNGSHVLTAIARDAAGNATTSAGRTVTVYNAPANAAPTMTQPANQTTAEGTAVSLALVASDPNGNPLTFSATGLPAGLTINTTSGVISGTPSYTTAGAFSVTATVSDGSLSASRTFSWVVTNTNRQPSLTQPANQTNPEGTAVTLSLSGSDPDSDPLSFTATGLPAGVTINIATGVISGTLTSTSAGNHSVTATVTDGSLSQSRTFSWTVSNVNGAPVFTQPANQTSAEGSDASITLAATDPDGDVLTFTATGLPAGAGVNAATGLISGTPGYTSAGTYTVTATVTDGSLSVSRTFSWIVTNTNRAPALTPVADQTTPADSDATLQIVASDPDGTALTYAATGLPPALTISSTTGLISGHVNAMSAGVHVVTVTVTDGVLSSSITFVWSVNDTDLPVRGDFDGDGRDDPATYREATGEWRVWPSSGNFAPAAPIVWGTGTDVVVSADYDGDGRTDLAVYRPSTGTWHALLSSTNMQSSLEVQWGNATDRPVAMDYDNDGKADLALPRFGGYQILLSGSNYTSSVTVR